MMFAVATFIVRRTKMAMTARRYCTFGLFLRVWLTTG